MSKTDLNKETGSLGEDIAVRFLVTKGYRILERNFRCKGGEVDIVASTADTACLVFVEVKARRSTRYGLPQQAVNLFKQRQISKAALTWLSRHCSHDHDARFDVIAIMLSDQGNHQVEHIINAFELAY